MKTTSINKLSVGFFIPLVFTTVLLAAPAGPHPNMYINAEEIAAIKVKIDSGEQPWKDTFDRVIEDAIEARDGELYSVTFGN
ncbi:MAG: hypothetical protein L3J24_05370, partial [Xanthomonadales bacterium]|nr:hypothetical protein [Xanthomonadales bacterium]